MIFEKALGDMTFIEIYFTISQTQVEVGPTVMAIAKGLIATGYPQDMDNDWNEAKKGLSSWILQEKYTVNTEDVATFLAIMEEVKRNDRESVHRKKIDFRLPLFYDTDQELISYLADFTPNNQIKAVKEMMRRGLKKRRSCPSK